MTKGLLESGEPQDPDYAKQAEEIESLRLQVRGLKQELREANDALEATKQQSAAATKALKILRTRLEPFHLALKFVFGELDAANIGPDIGDAFPGSSTPLVSPTDPGSQVHRKFAYWETWERKLGGKPGEIIRALLDHGRLNRTQVRSAISAGWTSVDTGLAKLKGLDLIEKNGDYWMLKEKV